MSRIHAPSREGLRATAPAQRRTQNAPAARAGVSSEAASTTAAHQLQALPTTRAPGAAVAQLGKGKESVRRGKVGRAEREMARAGRVGSGAIFGNNEGLLPKAPKGHHYEEIQPAAAPGGAAAGMGEHRVVVLKDNTGRTLKQYATYTHYGTGDSAAKNKADFIEF